MLRSQMGKDVLYNDLMLAMFGCLTDILSLYLIFEHGGNWGKSSAQRRPTLSILSQTRFASSVGDRHYIVDLCVGQTYDRLAPAPLDSIWPTLPPRER
jgi:hypothetical protein